MARYNLRIKYNGSNLYLVHCIGDREIFVFVQLTIISRTGNHTHLVPNVLKIIGDQQLNLTSSVIVRRGSTRLCSSAQNLFPPKAC